MKLWRGPGPEQTSLTLDDSNGTAYTEVAGDYLPWESRKIRPQRGLEYHPISTFSRGQGFRQLMLLLQRPSLVLWKPRREANILVAVCGEKVPKPSSPRLVSSVTRVGSRV
jgi:hypothetical protein